MNSFFRNLSRGRGTNEISSKITENFNLDIGDLNPFGSAEGKDSYLLGIMYIIFCFGIVTAMVHFVLFIVHLISSCCSKKKSTERGRYAKYGPVALTVILAITTSIFLIVIFTTAVPDFTSSLRLQVAGIRYDATEATEKFKDLKSRFDAIADKDLPDPEDYGKLAEDNFEDPMNALLDKTADFSDMKLYPVIYVIVLCMIILGIYYLPACLSVFCGLLAIVQIAAFVVILVTAVILTDVADIKYRPIIEKSAKGNDNLTKLVDFYFNEGPFLVDFDENVQAKVLADLPANKIVDELIKLKGKNGEKVPKVADVSDADLNRLPKNVKDKLKDYDGNDGDANELKDRLKKLGLIRRDRRQLADTDIDMTKVTKWYAQLLQTNGLENLKEDVKTNFPDSHEKFETITSATPPEDIAAAMNADPELKNAYVYPYSILKSGRIFQRDYLDGKMKTLTSAIEKNLVKPLGNVLICLFCLWLMTAGYMITVIACNCSGEEETEKETLHEISV